MKERLDSILVSRGIVSGRDRAKAVIMAGQVYIDGQKADKAAVDTASSVGLISGMGDGTFAPNENATRAQAASIVKRLLDK